MRNCRAVLLVKPVQQLKKKKNIQDPSPTELGTKQKNLEIEENFWTCKINENRE